MEGDKLVIEAHHTERAQELVPYILERYVDKMVITVAGESGAGKSETASEIARLLREHGRTAEILQQDDYFVFPPKTNHEMRRRNLEQVGMYEVKLGLLDSNLRSFKRGEQPLYCPHVNYDEDSISMIERDLSAAEFLIAEGTYTTSLRFADYRVFIARNYEDTAEHRAKRARDANDDFINDVLVTEHEIIRQHRELADAVISRDFQSIELLGSDKKGRDA